MLYVGDPRLVPVAPVDVDGGVAMALTGSGAPDLRDRYAPPSTPADDQLVGALREIASGSTQRGGRLLAPYGIRYVVVPIFDGANSTPSDPIEPPLGLLDALNTQLDLELAYTAADYVLYRNRSAMPAAAMLTGDLVAAAAFDTPAQLVRSDLSAAAPLFGDVLRTRSGTADVQAGVVHLAVPFDDNWTLRLGGEDFSARAGFGVLTAFDTSAAASAELSYDSPSSRGTALLGQALLWALALLAASRLTVPGWLGRIRRPRRAVVTAVIDLDEDRVALPTEAGDVPVMVPLEYTGPPAERPTAAVPAVRQRVPEVPSFDADAEQRAASWVDDMFADEDDLTDDPDGGR